MKGFVLREVCRCVAVAPPIVLAQVWLGLSPWQFWAFLGTILWAVVWAAEIAHTERRTR